jgi:dimethylaniline monooxygenase (N-oxide forming)
VGLVPAQNLNRYLVHHLALQLDRRESKATCRYSTRAGSCRDRGFDQLEYSPGTFWMNSPGGALHHSDFWNLAASRVSVHRPGITQLSSHSLHLSSQSRIPCDALLLGTGFTSSLAFYSKSLKAELSPPYHPNADFNERDSLWNDLEPEADNFVRARYPIIATPSPHRSGKTRPTPYYLYRGVVPVEEPSQSIVFNNFLVPGNLIMNAEVQAMWVVAYLTSSSSLTLPPIKDMRNEAAL